MVSGVRAYKILAFGRHFDLLNLAISVRESLQNLSVDVEVYSDRQIVDGQKVVDLDVSSTSGVQFIMGLLKNYERHVIHVLSPNPWSLCYALIGRALGCKVVYHCHRFDFSSFSGIKLIGIYLYTLLIFAISNRIFVHSRLSNRFLVWSKKIVYADLPNYSFSGQQIVSSDVGDTILFFGRIDSNKGIDLLLEIAVMRPNLRFHVAGELVDNGLKSYLSALSALANVKVESGRVAQNDLPALFRRAKCVILPYSDGTQSGVPFLARSLNTPVLVADVGDLASTVENPTHGVSVPTREAEVWADLLETTSWGDLRIAMCEEGLQTSQMEPYALVANEMLGGGI